MSTKEKIEFIDKVLTSINILHGNLKNPILHKVKRAMPNAVDVDVCDDSLGNYYICMIYNDDTIHSLHEIKDECVIEELYNLALFVKED